MSKKIIVEFQHLYDQKKGWDDEDNISPYVNMEYPDDDISSLTNGNEIVIPMREINIEYNYPLSHIVRIPMKSKSPKGFTRAELAKKISEGYHRIYREEEQDVPNPGHITGMFNRKSSNGRHGIWGHDLGNLVLHRVEQRKENLFSIFIDS